MKTAIAFTTLALLVAPAWAYHQDSNPDLKQSITNVHESHFPHVTADSHKPERGSGDSYGSVVLDDPASGHVPHKRGDSSHTTGESFPLSQ
ncbi:MAG TPA: hypothetical protein VN283_02485 [Thiobacillus sp.]|nr:hypothetical protein [Thiobacillus sp.]